jgi:hypothetical protein
MGQHRALFDDGDQHVGRHGDPYLRRHCVLAGAEEGLDAQVLLDPLEKTGSPVTSALAIAPKAAVSASAASPW